MTDIVQKQLQIGPKVRECWWCHKPDPAPNVAPYWSKGKHFWFHQLCAAKAHAQRAAERAAG